MHTRLFDRAVLLALRAHGGAVRRGKDTPYILHPMEAAAIVESMGGDEELLAAAMLHDVLEDTDCTEEEIRREFGPRVAALVAAESDPVFEGLSPEETWHRRKQAAIDRLAAASRDAKIVALGDKLSNMRAIARDHEKIGDALWQRFHAKDPADHAWHYRGLAASLAELSDTAAYREFVMLIEKTFGTLGKD